MHLIPRRVRHQHAASDNTGGALAVARLMLKEKRFVEAATLFERQEDSVRLDDAFMQAAMVAYTELNNPDKVREIAYTLAGLGNGKKAGGQLLKALCSSDSLADAESFLLQWLEHGLQAVGAQLVGASDTFSGSNLFIVPPTKTAVVASLGPIEYNRAASTLISPLLSHLRQRVKLDNSASIQVPADLAPQLFMSAIPWHVWAELVNMYAGRKAWQQSLMLLEFLEGLSALKESSSPPSSSVPHRGRGGDEVIVQITFDRALASAYKQAANSLAAGQQLSRLQDIISRAINHVDNDEALHIAAYVVRTASLWYHSAESQSATEPDDFLTELVATVSTLVSHSSRPSSGAAASPPGKREAALSNLLSATTSALCKQGKYYIHKHIFVYSHPLHLHPLRFSDVIMQEGRHRRCS